MDREREGDNKWVRVRQMKERATISLDSLQCTCVRVCLPTCLPAFVYLLYIQKFTSPTWRRRKKTNPDNRRRDQVCGLSATTWASNAKQYLLLLHPSSLVAPLTPLRHQSCYSNEESRRVREKLPGVCFISNWIIISLSLSLLSRILSLSSLFSFIFVERKHLTGLMKFVEKKTHTCWKG